MAMSLTVPPVDELSPRIVVLGVGGAGGNAVNNMIDADLQGVDFIAANTDSQALSRSKADVRLQLGAKITQGLGAGAKPEVGAQAAEDSLSEILTHLEGAHMVFITAGMGGGTGTGAAPVIARAAKEANLLTVGVVTKPFSFEGSRRMKTALAGIEELSRYVDTLIVIPNQNLFRLASKQTSFAEAFTMADAVLHSGVRGVTDLMTQPGLINLDFADVRTVMAEMGPAMMGTGEATGDNRAMQAAQAAISNPLLDDVTLKGARAVLINITGGMDVGLYEVDEVANAIRDEVDPDANIIVGTALDDTMDGRIRVSVVATGVEHGQVTQRAPGGEPQYGHRVTPLTVPALGSGRSVPEADPVEHDADTPVEAQAVAEDATVTRLVVRPEAAGHDEPLAHRDDRLSGAQVFEEDEVDEAPEPAFTEENTRTQRPTLGTVRADALDDFDENDLEIPAFLRRQAN